MASPPCQETRVVQQQLSRSLVRCDMRKDYTGTMCAGNSVGEMGVKDESIEERTAMRRLEGRRPRTRVRFEEANRNGIFPRPAIFQALRDWKPRIRRAFSLLAYLPAHAAL